MQANVISFKPTTNTQAKLSTVCLDIETMTAPDDVINQELALFKAPANYKSPEAIAKSRAEFEAKVREKSALLDGAPISVIALSDEQGDVVTFTWLNVEGDTMLENGVYSLRYDSERDMLVGLRAWANDCLDEQSRIVGFNLGFDLPHLRLAYARHGLKLPLFLMPWTANPTTDVMHVFTRFFSSKDSQFISLDEVTKRLGIAPEGKQLSGSDVPKYIEEGKHLDVVLYCGLDTVLTMKAFQILMGEIGD